MNTPICLSPNLKIPDVFLMTVDQTVSTPTPPSGSHPECGMRTKLTRMTKASSMIGLLRSSHEDKFQRTPVTRSRISPLDEFLNSLTNAETPLLLRMQRLFSSF